MAALSDEELVERYRTDPGSPRCERFLNELFQRHHARVAAWCLRMTGDVDAATDLAQDVFLKAFQRIESFRGDARFTTWLYSIARNHCMDQMRSRFTRPEQSTDTVMEDVPDLRSLDISADLEQRQDTELVRRLMRETLDETESQVMTLHYLHELPLESVTRLLRLDNQSGAKAYVVSAKRKLGRALTAWKNRQAR